MMTEDSKYSIQNRKKNIKIMLENKFVETDSCWERKYGDKTAKIAHATVLHLSSSLLEKMIRCYRNGEIEAEQEKECEMCSRIPCNCDSQYETYKDQEMNFDSLKNN